MAPLGIPSDADGSDVTGQTSEEHDDDSLGLSWALASSATEIEQDSPGFLSTIEASVREASMCGAVCSSSLGASSSNIVYVDDDDDDHDAASIN